MENKCRVTGCEEEPMLADLCKTHATVFAYLDWLRVTGETNMLGAAPYLVNHFCMDRHEARVFLSAWIKHRTPT